MCLHDKHRDSLTLSTTRKSLHKAQTVDLNQYKTLYIRHRSVVPIFFNSGPLRHYDLMKRHDGHIKYNIDIYIYIIKGKFPVHHITGHEGPEVEYRYSSTLSLTSALDGGGVINATPRPLYPRQRPGTHRLGGWAVPKAHLDGCGKYRPHQDSIRAPSSAESVLYRLRYPSPQYILYINIIFCSRFY